MRNTLRDLRDCRDALDNGDEMSAEEVRAAKDLLELCDDIASRFDADDIDSLKDDCEDEDED